MDRGQKGRKNLQNINFQIFMMKDDWAPGLSYQLQISIKSYAVNNPFREQSPC